MFHGWGNVASSIPTLDDIQKGNFKSDGWSGPDQRRNSKAHRDSDFHVLMERRGTLPPVPDPKPTPATVDVEKKGGSNGIESVVASNADSNAITPHDPSVPYANGYQFPPKHTWRQATVIALRGSWRFVTTPFGFLLTVYSLNIVAWGGMLFLILCRAAPAMNPPSCPDFDDKNCPAQIWLEITSQILNALFCVTGLGLIPWRFRDLYYLMQWRWKKNPNGLRRLAGIHRNWFRLEGSQNISPTWHQDSQLDTDPLPPGIDAAALAIPIKLSPDPPLTGERAPPSKYWKLDFVIWGFVWNTFLQIALCGIMWGLNRFTRPSWTTGLLISLACIVAMAAGWVIYKEGKKVKSVEGVPVSKEDQELLKEMNNRQTA
jgi:hypothetical protein